MEAGPGGTAMLIRTGSAFGATGAIGPPLPGTRFAPLFCLCAGAAATGTATGIAAGCRGCEGATGLANDP